MKRAVLVDLLKQNGWYFLRHGGEHDIFTNGIDTIAVPRHREIPEVLAKKILKKTSK